MILLIVILQVGGYFISRHITSEEGMHLKIDEEMEGKILALREEKLQARNAAPRDFNPNFISDYKGYLLGMRLEEIDRLHQFREQGLFVNSALEFQMVTGINDSLLAIISPYFKFPSLSSASYNKKKTAPKTATSLPLDINTASMEEFQRISGIGPVLSKRIVKFRNLLGGFRSEQQLLDVYGLSPEVAARAMKAFRIIKQPEGPLIDVNTADLKSLEDFPYFSRSFASDLITYREQNRGIASLEELKGIQGFPTAKFERIKLYLTL